MRKMTLTINCPENVLGTLLADITEKKGVVVEKVGVISERPVTENGRVSIKPGLNQMEALESVVKQHGREFSLNQLRDGFTKAGLSPASVNSFLNNKSKEGILKHGKERGQWVML